MAGFQSRFYGFERRRIACQSIAYNTTGRFISIKSNGHLLGLNINDAHIGNARRRTVYCGIGCDGDIAAGAVIRIRIRGGYGIAVRHKEAARRTCPLKAISPTNKAVFGPDSVNSPGTPAG